nr:N-acetylmuramoyl-L-alanine amidase [Streptomyces coryli]
MNRRVRATLLLAPLIPVCFAGYLVWQAVGDSDGGPQGGKPGASAHKDTEDKEGSSPPSSVKPQTDEKPLDGKVIVLDPGHNPNNRDHTAEINRKVDIGTGRKECDTTGAATNDGYSEAEFTLDVTRRAERLLTGQGATVKLTQDGKRAYGPCIDERAAIGNKAKADAVVSVHADGAGSSGDRGFHVIFPARVHDGVADTRPITADSRKLGESVLKHFAKTTGSRHSNYTGDGKGYTVRSDLGGLNLSKVPKVFIECGNMRNAAEADRLSDAGWRQRAAHGIADGIRAYLQG